MKAHESNHRSSGFTIVELLIVIIVSATLVSSLTMILVSHSHLSQRGRDVILVNAFAEAKVESLRSTGFSGLSDGTTNVTAEMPSELNAPRSAQLQISSHTAAVKRISLEITYNDQGASRTYAYTTYVGELGVGQY